MSEPHNHNNNINNNNNNNDDDDDDDDDDDNTTNRNQEIVLTPDSTRTLVFGVLVQMVLRFICVDDNEWGKSLIRTQI